MGLLGSTMVVVAFLLLAGTGFRIAQAARSEFAKLTATGLTIIIGFQAFFIIGGVVRLLPLTGITLPVRLLRRIRPHRQLRPHRPSHADLGRGRGTIDEAERVQYEQDRERRQRLLTGG